MKNIVEKALEIAREAHKFQKRKFGSNEPYIVHPEWCMQKAKALGYNEIVQCAMANHDVLEDVAIPTNTVEYWENRIITELEPQGKQILALVWELTNPSDTREWMEKNPDPKRSEKWAVNLAHIRAISDTAKACKMIDRLANLNSVEGAPHRWKQKYLPESKQLLVACYYVDEKLGQELEDAIKAMEKGM